MIPLFVTLFVGMVCLKLGGWLLFDAECQRAGDMVGHTGQLPSLRHDSVGDPEQTLDQCPWSAWLDLGGEGG